MIILGIIMLTLGVVSFYCVFKGISNTKGPALILASFFVIWGACICIGHYLSDPFLSYLITCLGTGLLLTATGVFNSYKVLTCSTIVPAVYMGSQPYKGRVGSFTHYSPVFHFQINDQSIERQSGESYLLSELERRYQEGQTYNIYVNRNDPKFFLTKKAIKVRDIIVFLVGIFLTAAPATILSTYW